METQYLPKSHNYCVYAEYAHKKSNFYGWDLAVHNHAEEADGTVHDSTKDTKGAGLCAKLVNATAGKLEVPLQTSLILICAGRPVLPTTVARGPLLGGSL